MSFEVGPGKVLGILGRNGSGKSTLLQIVAGRMQPTGGELEVQGTVAALLELGAGFNPDFTGRENALFSGTLHGVSTAEMKNRLGAIIEFADIGDHIDMPVKTYSSGMFARLAFSVAVSVDPALLLVDEILSVGDISFQARCYKRIEEMKRQGTSILFVSHDLNTMQMLCDEVLLLEQGQMITRGDPKVVTELYRDRMVALKPETDASGQDQSRRERGRFEKVRLVDEHGKSVQHAWVGDTFFAHVDFIASEDIAAPIISLQIQTMQGVVVYDLNSQTTGQDIHHLNAGDHIHVQVRLELHLCPGPFRLAFGMAILQDDLPKPILGSHPVAFEAISDQPAYGFANLHSRMEIQYL
ncbi:MAG: ABC transporter ATP-binding protein [Kiritimatiellia bacterium]